MTHIMTAVMYTLFRVGYYAMIALIASAPFTVVVNHHFLPI